MLSTYSYRALPNPKQPTDTILVYMGILFNGAYGSV